MISDMMKKIENVTCVTFKPVTIETDFLEIWLRRNRPCGAFIGYTDTHVKAMFLQDDCMEENGILHELMHVLGFHHEHNRFDRDRYVAINYTNIVEKYLPNFQKRSILEDVLIDIEYDFNSVTHFPSNAFAKDKSMPTIIPNDGREIKINGLSEKDILKINRYYRCNWKT